MTYEYLPLASTRYIASEIIEAAEAIREAPDSDLSEELEYINLAVAELARRSGKARSTKEPRT